MTVRIGPLVRNDDEKAIRKTYGRSSRAQRAAYDAQDCYTMELGYSHYLRVISREVYYPETTRRRHEVHPNLTRSRIGSLILVRFPVLTRPGNRDRCIRNPAV
jgi:hypothetical protein